MTRFHFAMCGNLHAGDEKEARKYLQNLIDKWEYEPEENPQEAVTKVRLIVEKDFT